MAKMFDINTPVKATKRNPVLLIVGNMGQSINRVGPGQVKTSGITNVRKLTVCTN